MQTKGFLLLALGLIFFTATAMHLAFFNWTPSADYEVRFRTSSAKGTFSGLEGTIRFNPDDLSQAMMDVRVAVNTISTGNKTKDRHAKNTPWFDAENHPYITFRSSAFEATAEGYKVKGRLELKGVENEIEIPFTFIPDGNSGLFQGSFTVDRKAYGIRGSAFGFTVGKKVSIDLKIPVTK